MQKLQQFVESNLATLFVYAISCGLFGLAFELHLSQLNGSPHIPTIVLSVIGGILPLLGLNLAIAFKQVFGVLLLVISLFGIGGVIGHVAAPVKPDAIQSLQSSNVIVEGARDQPAPLAPLAFSGMMILGAIALVAQNNEAGRD